MRLRMLWRLLRGIPNRTVAPSTRSSPSHRPLHATLGARPCRDDLARRVETLRALVGDQSGLIHERSNPHDFGRAGLTARTSHVSIRNARHGYAFRLRTDNFASVESFQTPLYRCKICLTDRGGFGSSFLAEAVASWLAPSSEASVSH